jgi:histidyl-tRNA synthetase
MREHILTSSALALLRLDGKDLPDDWMSDNLITEKYQYDSFDEFLKKKRKSDYTFLYRNGVWWYLEENNYNLKKVNCCDFIIEEEEDAMVVAVSNIQEEKNCENESAKKKIIAPEGTRDYYPQDMRIRKWMSERWSVICEKYGFEPYDAPTFEYAELQKLKEGGNLRDETYSFKDKDDKAFVLRPEMTPSLARMVAAKETELKKPIKWYSIPKCFRFETTQHGRRREFSQLNVDLLGVEGVGAEVEILAILINMLCSFGLNSNNFIVRISSRAMLQDLFLSIGVKKENLSNVYDVIDKIRKKSEVMSEQEIHNWIDGEINDPIVANKVKEVIKVNSLEGIAQNYQDCCALSLSHIQEIFTKLKYIGLQDFVEFDMSTVRGLGYYTGVVFEVFEKVENNKTIGRAIAGGGRFDNLVGFLGANPIPAVGFGMGDEVLYNLLKKFNLLPLKKGRNKEVPADITNWAKRPYFPESIFTGKPCLELLKDYNFLSLKKVNKPESISKEFSARFQEHFKNFKFIMMKDN